MTACMAEYGPRFDTAGAVTAVRRDGLDFCAREGLIDEFNIQPPLSPPGYEAARPGEAFVKIGVGWLTRVDEEPYRFSRAYPVRQLARVEVERQGEVLSVSQSLPEESGWGYAYRKIYRVDVNAAALVIDYDLANTGRRLIHAEQYNHNWFNLGGGTIDAAYALETKLALGQHTGTWAERRNGGLVLTGTVDDARYFPSPCSAPAAANALRVKHAARGLAVLVTGDFDVARFALFADRTALCPEVFVDLVIEPGQRRAWQRRYQFLTSPGGA